MFRAQVLLERDRRSGKIEIGNAAKEGGFYSSNQSSAEPFLAHFPDDGDGADAEAAGVLVLRRRTAGMKCRGAVVWWAEEVRSVTLDTELGTRERCPGVDSGVQQPAPNRI